VTQSGDANVLASSRTRYCHRVEQAAPKEDLIMTWATRWRTPIGIAIVVLLILAALILALVVSGAENGEGMGRPNSQRGASRSVDRHLVLDDVRAGG
jgi:hypothetical protein